MRGFVVQFIDPRVDLAPIELLGHPYVLDGSKGESWPLNSTCCINNKTDMLHIGSTWEHSITDMGCRRSTSSTSSLKLLNLSIIEYKFWVWLHGALSLFDATIMIKRDWTIPGPTSNVSHKALDYRQESLPGVRARRNTEADEAAVALEDATFDQAGVRYLQWQENDRQAELEDMI